MPHIPVNCCRHLFTKNHPQTQLRKMQTQRERYRYLKKINLNTTQNKRDLENIDNSPYKGLFSAIKQIKKASWQIKEKSRMPLMSVNRSATVDTVYQKLPQTQLRKIKMQNKRCCYLLQYGKRAIWRALFKALVNSLWCLVQVPAERLVTILPLSVKNFESLPTSL